MPEQKRRTTVDAAGQQVGEQHVDAAGGNINHGADATAVLEFLRAYVFEADQRREVGIKAVATEIQRARGDMGIISDAVRSLRDRADADARQRHERQGELDAALGEFAEALEAQAADMAALRRGQYRLAWAIVALVVLWLLGLFVLALLIYDRYAAEAMLRAWLGAGAALALWRR